MSDRISVLDQGYVEFIEAWGHGRDGRNYYNEGEHDYECGVIEAARQSTQGAFRGWADGDAKLLRYLYDHQHTTPFEFAGFTLEVKLPIMVAREWVRHRTQSFNEASARYAPLAAEYYMPTVERVMTAGAKQGGAVAGAVIDMGEAERFLRLLKDEYSECEWLYQQALATGVPKELARLVMPVGHYTQWRVSANLWNWLRFLRLRLDPAAQFEIRAYAEAVGQIVAKKFPRTWEAFTAC